MILSKILQKFKVLASKLSKFLFKIAHYTSYKTQYEESNISVRQSDLVLGYFHLFLFLLCTCKKHLVFVVLVLKCCTWLFFPPFHHDSYERCWWKRYDHSLLPADSAVASGLQSQTVRRWSCLIYLELNIVFCMRKWHFYRFFPAFFLLLNTFVMNVKEKSCKLHVIMQIL